MMSRGNRRGALSMKTIRTGRRIWRRWGRRMSGWVVHAYVLMSNHYHLLLETPEPNLVAGMKWFQGVFTNRYNQRHG